MLDTPCIIASKKRVERFEIHVLYTVTQMHHRQAILFISFTQNNINVQFLFGVQLCFRRFPIDGFSGK